MFKILSELSHIKVDGVWRELKAVLTTTHGGYKVLYLDGDGYEIHSEKASRSQFKEAVRQLKKGENIS